MLNTNAMQLIICLWHVRRHTESARKTFRGVAVDEYYAKSMPLYPLFVNNFLFSAYVVCLFVFLFVGGIERDQGRVSPKLLLSPSVVYSTEYSVI